MRYLILLLTAMLTACSQNSSYNPQATPPGSGWDCTIGHQNAAQNGVCTRLCPSWETCDRRDGAWCWSSSLGHDFEAHCYVSQTVCESEADVAREPGQLAEGTVVSSCEYLP